MKKDSYQVSVLIVTYYSEWAKIKLTLNSILKQKNVDFEIVVSDDGSEDNQFDKIRAYFKKRKFEDYTLVAHEKNQGTVRNVITGLEYCRGKYVKGLGPADMFMDSFSLVQMYSFLETYQYEAGFCLMQGYTVLPNNKYNKKSYHYPFDLTAYKKEDAFRIQKNEVYYSDHISDVATFFRTDFYLEYMRKIEPYVRYEEDIFQVMAALDGRFFHLFDKKLVWYELGYGISTSKKSGYSELLKKDSDSFYDFIFQKYKDNLWVKKRKKIAWCYKIRNLYLRTLIRFLVNPDAVRYLISHYLQVLLDVYQQKTNLVDHTENLKKR